MDATIHFVPPLEPLRGTVVVIDDDPALLGALRFDLELEGLTVQTYEAAYKVPAEHLPVDHACLVIDYRLPGINGLELLRRLRNLSVSLPAIVITSHPSKSLKAQIAALGADLIEKPLLGDQLIARIREILAPSKAAP